MVRKMRSSTPSSAPSGAPFFEHVAKKPRRVTLEASNRSLSDRELIDDLLYDVFIGMAKGHWWLVLPDYDDRQDIELGTGQDWDVLLPILIKGGFLLPQSKST